MRRIRPTLLSGYLHAGFFGLRGSRGEGGTSPGQTAASAAMKEVPVFASHHGGEPSWPGEVFPGRPLPPPFQSLPVDAVSGEVLVSRETVVDSVEAMLARALERLASYFDSHPSVVRALAARDGSEIQALFRAGRSGQPVCGLAIVRLEQQEGTVGVLVDWADRFPRSLPILSQVFRRGLLQWPRAEPASLQPVPLPDGSGTIHLPPGWRIMGAQHGMLSAEGPHGSVDLGIWVPVYTPQAAALMPEARPPLVAPYGEPAQALEDLFPQWTAFLRQMGQPAEARFLETIDQAPAPTGVGKGAFIHYEWERGEEERWQSVALVLMNSSTDGTWNYHASTISAPSDRFPESLPVLQGIWESWKVADHTLRQQLDRALNRMRGTGRIYQRTNASRRNAIERATRTWSRYLRDGWPDRDVPAGKRREAPADLQSLIHELNELEGYERYRPLSENQRRGW